MPVIEVHLLEGYSSDDKRRLGEALTDATRLVVPASPELVTVMIHEMPASNYYRGRTSRTPAPALSDPCAIVEEFLQHLGQRNLERARNLIADDFVMLFPATAAMHQFEQLIEWSKSRHNKIEKTMEGIEALHSAGDETVVYCRGTLSGEWTDGTPFNGIRFVDRFELVNGKITRQEVWNDIAETKSIHQQGS